MSEKHEWYLKDVVCIDNSNKTRHLGYHHDGQCKKKKISDAIPVEISTMAVEFTMHQTTRDD